MKGPKHIFLWKQYSKHFKIPKTPSELPNLAVETSFFWSIPHTLGLIKPDFPKQGWQVELIDTRPNKGYLLIGCPLGIGRQILLLLTVCSSCFVKFPARLINYHYTIHDKNEKLIITDWLHLTQEKQQHAFKTQQYAFKTRVIKS
jgi:hypothetical protein